MEILLKKKVLVVGGRGFIGQALVRKLVNYGAEVISLSRTNTSISKAMADTRQVTANIFDRSALANAIRDEVFEYVFNLGGYVDHSSYQNGGRSVVDTHYIGTLNLIEQVYNSELKGFVQVGSSDEYGDAVVPQREDLRETPISPYSAAKTGITHLIQALARTEGFPGVVTRLFLVYGPGQNERRFLPQIINGCLNNSSFATSEGKQLRDFCYVDDVVDGMILSAITPKAYGHVINIASGKAVTIRSIVEQIVAIIGKGQPQFGVYPYRSGENMALYADITKANNLLGWHPTITLQEGLQKTIKYFLNKKK